jgi:ribonuclease R
VTSLDHDYYHFDAAHHRLVGERTGQVFRLGDHIVVSVAKVNLEDKKIDFDLVSAERKPRKTTARLNKEKSENGSVDSDNADTAKNKGSKKKSSKKKTASSKRDADGNKLRHSKKKLNKKAKKKLAEKKKKDKEKKKKK